MMQNRTRLLKLTIAIASTVFSIALVLIVVSFLISSNSKDNEDPAKKEEMIALILEWGRLSPFPVSASNVLIETEGNSFTRSFRARFVAPQEEIQTWIEDSPGLKEATPEELSANKVQYVITPGSGVNRAEVTIDYVLNQVDIYVSWG